MLRSHTVNCTFVAILDNNWCFCTLATDAVYDLISHSLCIWQAQCDLQDILFAKTSIMKDKARHVTSSHQLTFLSLNTNSCEVSLAPRPGAGGVSELGKKPLMSTLQSAVRKSVKALFYHE